jgi:hypothetical protein
MRYRKFKAFVTDGLTYKAGPLLQIWNNFLGDELRFYPASTVADLRLKNGDTLHVAPMAGTRFTDIEDTVQPSTSTSSSSSDLVPML